MGCSRQENSWLVFLFVLCFYLFDHTSVFLFCFFLAAQFTILHHSFFLDVRKSMFSICVRWMNLHVCSSCSGVSARHHHLILLGTDGPIGTAAGSVLSQPNGDNGERRRRRRRTGPGTVPGLAFYAPCRPGGLGEGDGGMLWCKTPSKDHYFNSFFFHFFFSHFALFHCPFVFYHLSLVRSLPFIMSLLDRSRLAGSLGAGDRFGFYPVLQSPIFSSFFLKCMSSSVYWGMRGNSKKKHTQRDGKDVSEHRPETRDRCQAVAGGTDEDQMFHFLCACVCGHAVVTSFASLSR